MLYIVGLGLGDERDITIRGLEAVKNCDKVYIEAYTSLLSFGLSSDGLSRMEKLYGKTITIADREMVEEKVDKILTEASESDVAFLVVGDPFGATTHSDLVVRAKKLLVEVKVIHNASIMNAIGVCGLQLYRYGETVSIPFFTETWRPYSFYEKIQRNKELGLHTLCLLDIRVKEPSIESLCRGRKCFEPPRFMTINTAIEQLLEIEEALGACGIFLRVLSLPSILFMTFEPYDNGVYLPSYFMYKPLNLIANKKEGDFRTYRTILMYLHI